MAGGPVEGGGTLRLDVLGPVRAHRRGQELYLGRRKPFELLAVLAASPDHEASAGRLLDQVWGRNPDRKAMDTLKNAVWQANKRFDETFGVRPVISTGGDGYGLDREVVAVDATLFAEAHGRATELAAAGDLVEANRAAVRACGFWRGDVAFPDFEHLSLVADQARVLDSQHLAADKLRFQTAVDLGRHEEVLAPLAALVDTIPDDESLCSLLMLALARSGRQPEALQAYDRLRQALIDVAGMEPSPALQDLQMRILSRHDSVVWQPSRRQAAPPPVVVPRSLPVELAPLAAEPFHGREAELDRVVELLEHPSVVAPVDEPDAPAVEPLAPIVVVGHSGMGKTRFLAALAERVVGSGRRVLYGRCRIDDTDALAAVGSLIAATPTSDRPGPRNVQVGPVAADGPGLSLAVEVDPALELDRRIDGAVEALRAATGSENESDGPAPVLVIDDAQWADRASLVALERFCRDRHDPPGVILAGRPEAIEVSEEADGTVARWLAERTWAPVELGPLADEAVQSLVGEVLPPRERARAEAVADLIQRNGRGVPLLVNEMLRAVEVEVASGQPFSLGHIQTIAPKTLRATVHRRMLRLDQRATEAVKAAAVAGPTFELDVLATVLDRGEDETATLLDHCIGARLIGEVTSGPLGHYHFAHDMLRDAVLGEVGVNQQARLHRRFAEAVELLRGPEAARERATHLVGALPLVDPDEAVAATLEAAQRTVEAFDVDGAIGLLQRALDALDGLDVPEHRICDLLVALGAVQSWGGEVAAAASTLGQAVEVARRLDDPIRLADAVMASGPDHRVVFGDSTRLDLLREVHQQLGADDPGPLAISIEAALLGESLLPGRPAQPVRAPDDLVEHASRVGDPAAEIEARFAAHSAAKVSADVDHRWRLVDGIVALAEGAEVFTRQYCGGLGCRTYDLINAGRFVEAAELAERLGAIAVEHSMPRYRWRAAVMTGALQRLAGDFDRANRLASEALTIGRSFDPADAEVVFGMQMHDSLRHTGSLRVLVDPLGQIVRGSSGPGGEGAAPPPPVARLMLIQALAADEDLHQAEQLWMDEREVVVGLPAQELWLPTMALAAELATTVVPDPDTAVDLERALLPFAGQWVPVGVPMAVWGPVDGYLGLLAALLGRPVEARSRLQEAERQCRQAGAEPWRDWLVALAKQFDLDLER